ncbi:sensor histidine kinase [Neomoorella humiferrea]|uniref:Oxygen sensor histidine kinase NreB n=1 Tax=Neomoorella humiferrea TaxID=676965 RepID=A0A2T0AWG9_9FIRM|nr:sensor histidine kinase [Moorella humiferrea]PRR75046.1 Signal transduction histidine-protein kinase/phosphatase DegS [Moorella humiferrea]
MGQGGVSSLRNDLLQQCPSFNKKEVCPVKAESCPCPGRKLRINVHHAQERESKRWAMELHDSVAQTLGCIILDFDTFITSIYEENMIKRAHEIKYKLQNLYDTLREMLFELRAPYMEEGLAKSLENYLERVAENTNIKFNAEITKNFTGVHQMVQVEIFRIVQEAVTNIKKHSHASEATVKVIFKGDCIQIYVADNGRGFDVNKLKGDRNVDNKHFGLISIKERTQMLGGDFILNSEPGKGTVIDITIPPIGTMGSGLIWNRSE